MTFKKIQKFVITLICVKKNKLFNLSTLICIILFNQEPNEHPKSKIAFVKIAISKFSFGKIAQKALKIHN